MKSILTAFGIVCVLVSNTTAESTEAERTQWFREARFGMFIHWGVYAVPAGEWNGETIKGIGEWIMRFRKVPVAKYKSFAPEFTAANYNPEQWAELANKAGMKYVVITSKHHDGFALYDSAVTDWDVMASGAKRDLLAPLAKAVRARDMKGSTIRNRRIGHIPAEPPVAKSARSGIRHKRATTISISKPSRCRR
jgi:alpha-L-fucosidase